jgi:hypothetical protein
MKFCQPHWDKLRAALKERGVDHLGAKTGEQAIADMSADFDGREREYDPLMDCHWMITNRALESGGLYLMGAKEDGSQYCPVCEAEAHGVPVDSWINGAADAGLAHCRELGLVPTIQ